MIGAKRAISYLAAAAMVVSLPIAPMEPGQSAVAAPACTKTWASPGVSGRWQGRIVNDPVLGQVEKAPQWNPPGEPTDGDDVCLPASATPYTVTKEHDFTLHLSPHPGLPEGFNAGVAKSITIGSGATVLVDQGPMTVSNGVNNSGGFALHGSSTQGGGDASLVLGSSVLESSGLVSSSQMSLDHSYIVGGSIVNTGEIRSGANSTLEYDSGSLTNRGVVTVEGSSRFQVGSNGGSAYAGAATFTNDTSGSIADNGDFVVSNNSTFIQGAGTTTGNPITLGTRCCPDGPATLNLTGTGGSSFKVEGSSAALTGNPAAGQSVLVNDNAIARVAASLTGSGLIRLAGQTSLPCCASSILEVAGGTGTLTNVGTLKAVNAGGLISGNLVNQGTVELDATPAISSAGHSVGVSGSARLAGTLKLNVVSSAMPQPGDRYVVMNFASSTGVFDRVDFAGQPFQVIYNPQNVTVLVLTATSTALTSAPNPSVVGQAVTFSATVGPASGTGTPTGTVTFQEGSTTLGTGTLSGGAATLTTSSLSAGPHIVLATYGGDGTFAGSTSMSVAQTVTTVAPTTTTTVAPTTTTTVAPTTTSRLCATLQSSLNTATDPFVKSVLMRLFSGLGCTAPPGTTTTLPAPTTTTVAPPTSTTTVGSTTNQQICAMLRSRQATAGPAQRPFIDTLLMAFGC